MPYAVVASTSFTRDLEALPQKVRERVARKVDALATAPRPPGAEKLKGTADAYRVRIGAYRLVYAIKDDVLIIVLVRVRHRREVYR